MIAERHYPYIIIAVGTRPEVIKMAPLFHCLSNNSYHIELLLTGQHGSMVEQSLDIFGLNPSYKLNVLTQNQSLDRLTSKILNGSSNIFSEQSPDMVLVHGDTTTTLACSMAAFYNNIPVGHVEAGLRTNDKKAPFPEEINRRLTDQIADLHFAPTENNYLTLIKENIPADNISITGNTVIDALFWIRNKVQTLSDSDVIDFDYKNSKYILVTAHRRENHGKGIVNICRALKLIAQSNPNVSIVYPVHLNPNIDKVVRKELGGIDNIYLIQPMNYEDFVSLMKYSWIILTDSGGIQEEAPAFNIPVLVMRDKTERQEAVKAGTIKLVGTTTENIVRNCEALMNNNIEYTKMANSINPYGDGSASRKIMDKLNTFFNL